MCFSASGRNRTCSLFPPLVACDASIVVLCRAQKLMGRLYSEVSQSEKALVHYERWSDSLDVQLQLCDSSIIILLQVKKNIS